MIVTIDVENPSVTRIRRGADPNPLNTSGLQADSIHRTSESQVGAADLTINGQTPSIDSITGAYSTMYIKSNSYLLTM